jgi:transcription termination factor Rho
MVVWQDAQAFPSGRMILVNVGSHRSRRRRRRGRGSHPGGGGPQQGAPPRPAPPPRGPADVLGLPPAPPPVAAAKGRTFEDLTSIDPQPRITLEYPGCPASTRLIDLFCPIGRGQRGLIVSPPKAGKTTLLKDIGTSVLRNHPDLDLIVLLVDERPEEVTDFRRHFAQVVADLAPPPIGALNVELNGQHSAEPVPTAAARCHVVGSSNDNDTERHIAISVGAMEYAKQMVMGGRHVVILLDSLTRLGRAFNRSRKHASSGRTLTGGIDSRALEVPKQIFGAARNTEEAGSLTIIATCLVDTGSQGDQVIFEEFKGTGNMELILDRKISERRLFPAINLAASGTRKEHLLMSEQEIKTITALRRRLMNMPPHVQVEQLLAALQRFGNNAALVGSG